MKIPTFQAAVVYFAEERNAIDYMVRLRWPDGVVKCPTCDSTDVTFLPTRSLFQCKGKHRSRQFSVKVGTVLESSPIPLGKWLLTAWMLMNCRNGVSSYEVARTIGVTQKSAWFMLHRLRLAMQDFQPMKLRGVVEADETFVGGLVKNMHPSKRPAGTGYSGRPVGAMAKTIVAGMVERGGSVKAAIIPERSKEVIHELTQKHIEPGSTLISDEWGGYRGTGLEHHVINHAESYVLGPVHTNTIENFWSCLKRTLKGTYIAVQKQHLMAYVQEQSFRFNHRKKALYSEEMRFQAALGGMVGKRLTYKELIGKVA